MKLSALLPALSSLRKYLEQAVEYAEAQRKQGLPVDPNVITFFLVTRMQDWDPKINRVHVLDPPTRQAAARFLGGVAANLVSAANASTRRRSA